MFDAGAIVGKLTLDTSKWSSAINKAKADSKSFEGAIMRNQQQIRKLGVAFTALGAIITAVSVKIVKMAMDTQESENLFEVSMGNMAKSARKWSIALSKSLGLNQYEIRKTIGTFNVMISSMGLSEQAAYDMSKGLTQLGYDMASFYNLNPEEAFLKIQSALSGEAEPLKRLGILVNETTIQTWALNNGLIKQGEVLTEEQKVIARYNVILEATKASQGDLARTIGSTTNQWRIMLSKIDELTTTLGNALLPMVTKAISQINNMIDSLSNFIDAHKKLTEIIVILTSIFGLFLLVLGPLIIALPGLAAAAAGLGISLGALITIAIASVAAIGSIVIVMRLVRSTMISIIPFLQKLWWSFAAAINEGVIFALKGIQKLVDLMAKLPGKAGAIWKGASDGIDGMIASLKNSVELAEKKFVDTHMKAQESINGISDAVKANVEANASTIDNSLDETNKKLDKMNKAQKFFVSDFVDSAKSMFGQFGIELELTMQKANDQMTYTAEMVLQKWTVVFEAVGDIISTIQGGLSDTVYNLITGAESLKEVWKGVGQSILKTIIDMLVKIGTQQAVLWLMNLLGIAKHITSRMATLAAETYGAAFASTAAIPIVGPAMAPAVAATSTATMLAGAAAASATGAGVGAGMINIPGLAEGGEIVRPGYAIVGEAGPELLNLNKGAEVRPLSKAGQHIEVKANFYGDIKTDADLDEVGRIIGKKITNEIRGL